MVVEGAQILVVDDNEMNRDMLSRRLRRQKYEVTVAEDGEKALNMVKEQSYDLILLDIMMPNISGYDVLERIKTDPDTRHIPIIMISAVDDLDSVVRCIELGAEDYLFKPFNPVLLKARVDASLRKNRLNSKTLHDMIGTMQVALSTLQNTTITDDQAEAIAQLAEQVDILRDVMDKESR